MQSDIAFTDVKLRKTNIVNRQVQESFIIHSSNMNLKCYAQYVTYTDYSNTVENSTKKLKQVWEMGHSEVVPRPVFNDRDIWHWPLD